MTMPRHRDVRRRGFGSPWVWGLLTIIAFAAFGYTWWLSPTVTTTITRPHTVTYTFDYRSADRVAEEVYGPEGLRFGDTVFLALVDRLVVDIAFDPHSPGNVVGDTDLEVVGRLSSSAGWTSEILPSITGRETGDVMRASVVVDFDEVTAEIARLDELTATTGSYSLEVTAHGSTTALVDPPGRVLVDDRSSASIEFDLTPSTAAVISPAASSAPQPGRLGPSMVDADPSVSTVTKMVSGDSARPRTISIGVADVDLATVRAVVGLTAAGLALLTLLAVVTRAVRRRRRSEADRLLDRHRRRVLPLAGWNEHLERYAVEVADFEALETISAASQLPILYVGHDGNEAVPDSSGPDTGRPDTGRPDTGGPGTGRPDTGRPDTGRPDTSVPVTRFVVIDGSTSFVYRANGRIDRRPHHHDRHTEISVQTAVAP